MAKAKKKSTKSVASQSVAKKAKDVIESGDLSSAMTVWNRSSKKQKALVAGGVLAVLGLLSTKKGRAVLSSATGLAAPILAGLAKDKIVEEVSNAM